MNQAVKVQPTPPVTHTRSHKYSGYARRRRKERAIHWYVLIRSARNSNRMAFACCRIVLFAELASLMGSLPHKAKSHVESCSIPCPKRTRRTGRFACLGRTTWKEMNLCLFLQCALVCHGCIVAFEYAHVVLAGHQVERCPSALSTMRAILWLLGLAISLRMGTAYIVIPARATALAACGWTSGASSCASFVRKLLCCHEPMRVRTAVLGYYSMYYCMRTELHTEYFEVYVYDSDIL